MRDSKGVGSCESEDPEEMLLQNRQKTGVVKRRGDVR